MKYIGVDLGGTNIAAGLVSEEGKILAQLSTPTLVGRHYSEVMADMADVILRLLEREGVSLDEIAYIGIGSPGAIDADKGVVVFANNLYWHHVPVREELQKHIDKPVYIDNDANVAGLAEFKAGVSQGAENSIFLTLGTGVGGGVIIGGRIYVGSHNVGSELGHMIVSVNGRECTCGNKGCWETYTSATALIKDGVAAAQAHPDSLIATSVGGDLSQITAKTVLDAAKAEDPAALEVFDNYLEYMAMGIVSIINCFDPEIIAIGGGVSKAGQWLIDKIAERVALRVFYKDLPYAKIVLAQLGNDAGIIGAAMLGKQGMG